MDLEGNMVIVKMNLVVFGQIWLSCGKCHDHGREFRSDQAKLGVTNVSLLSLAQTTLEIFWWPGEKSDDHEDKTSIHGIKSGDYKRIFGSIGMNVRRLPVAWYQRWFPSVTTSWHETLTSS